jgi:hypothetical protein
MHAHASLYNVTGTKFKTVSLVALTYGSGLFKLIGEKVTYKLVRLEKFCSQLRDKIRFGGICRLHLKG